MLLTIQHLAKILVPPGLREHFIVSSGTHIIHVTQGHDVGTQFGDLADVVATHASGADACKIDAVARCCMIRTPEQMSRYHHEGKSGGGGRGGEGST